MSDDLELLVVRTNECLYVSAAPGAKYSLGSKQILFDGTNLEKSFHSSWFICPSAPKKITLLKSRPNINYRYVLVEDAPGKDVLPPVMPRAEVVVPGDDECVWREDLRHLQSLYELTSDPQDPEEIDIPFTMKELLYIPSIKEISLGYEIYRGRWGNEISTVSNSIIRHQELDKIVFPPVVLPETPCLVSSENMYDIIRCHVKSHINPESAIITSDYDFCFTVKKRVILHDPYELKREIKKANGKSYRNPKYRSSYIKQREVECFEMTHNGHRYQGYTPIPDMHGESHEDLKAKIDKYLADLMEMINEPLRECPHCNGMGVIGGA